MQNFTVENVPANRRDIIAPTSPALYALSVAPDDIRINRLARAMLSDIRRNLALLDAVGRDVYDFDGYSAEWLELSALEYGQTFTIARLCGLLRDERERWIGDENDPNVPEWV